MIVVECEQGSAEWVSARIGRPTASNFGKIVTPKGAPSRASDGYICQLLAEWMMDAALDEFVNEWMERGREMEQQAVSYYELQRDMEVQRVGFITTDDGRVGCSPDALVGDDGGMEIKCPSARVHVENLLDMPSKYMPQVQGCLWITGRKWWDLLSYHPEMPPALVRIERDDKWIAALEKHLWAFLQRLEAGRQRLGKLK